MVDRLVALLFALGVFAVPFDAIPGVGAIGELSNEASFYCFAAAMVVQVLRTVGSALVGAVRPPLGSAQVLCLGAVMLGAVLLSGLFNAAEIATASFHGRSGATKILTSAGVIVYGIALAWLACRVVPGRWYACLILPVCLSAVVCIGYGVLEGAHRAGTTLPVFTAIDAAVHAGSDREVNPWDNAVNLKLVEGWDPRLRTLSFEPPAFGNFAGLAWPWLLCAVMMTRGTRRLVHLGLLAAFTVLIVASQARTGWLLLAANLACFGALRLLFLPSDGRVDAAAARGAALLLLAGIAGGVAAYVSSLDRLVAEVIAGDSVSDLSRLAYQLTALNIFAAQPILGAGLGQFAFLAALHMPAWGFLSPEIGASLVHPEAPWPNTYSLYARIAAELGLVGLAGWLLVWGTLILAVRRAGLRLAGRGGAVPPIAYSIIMNAAGILVTGITTDTYRTPMMWLALGAGACFVARAVEGACHRAPAR
ncbi:O-antigen ligase family protein [Falsiroseomonas sp. HW251]|uniref:O-antigen ligase family protein n=1 Tax=Falsiroseomonas sp. HW251 TaxID=3390998 RepID=UPI003D312302